MNRATRSWIYTLTDPQTDEIRYVGHSINPTQRLKAHVAEARRNKSTRKNRWLRELAIRELNPILLFLESVPMVDIGKRERYWIERLREETRLTNDTDGGDGVMKDGVSWCKGRPKTPEHRQKLAAVDKSYMKGNNWGKPGPYFKGRRHSEETRKKMSETHKKIGSVKRLPRYRDLPQETRLRMSAALKALDMNGEKNPQSKLKPEQVRYVRQVTSAGSVSYRELALQLGVSKSLIGLIVGRKIWRHV